MSLFPSAFDTGLPSTSSSKPLTLGGGGAGGKRKRPSMTNTAGKDEQLRATQVNLAKLMDRVDRGDFTDKDRSGREAMGHMGKKKAKKSHDAPAPAPPTGNKGKKAENKGPKPAAKVEPSPKVEKKKKGKPPAETPPSTKAPKNKGKGKLAPVELDLELPTPKADPSDGLTDMQRKMQTKLEGARFRWINEQLYSTSSDEAVAMMDKDPKVFADYHDTHRQQTAAWPQPPLEHITALLEPLPRGAVIADLGCGDAGLARALVPAGKVVLSYDLVGDVGGSRSQGTEGWVVPCDFLSGVPLPGRPGGVDEQSGGKKKKGKRDPAASEVVDAVVCCLSLMGTNWVGGVYEAARILKQGGAFHVAEVTSRFVSTEAFVEAITSFGLELVSQEEPSTHFTLFKFVKTVPAPLGPVRGQDGWDERIEAGEEILRACVYKRR